MADVFELDNDCVCLHKEKTSASLHSPHLAQTKSGPAKRLGEIKEQHQKQLNTSTKARPKCTPKKAGALLCKQGPEGAGLDMKKAADSCPSKAA